ncbi:hypothetical protein ABTK08_19700, partial [Acinetobacter baumannii]
PPLGWFQDPAEPSSPFLATPFVAVGAVRLAFLSSDPYRVAGAYPGGVALGPAGVLWLFLRLDWGHAHPEPGAGRGGPPAPPPRPPAPFGLAQLGG